ncbi:protein NASP homolog [Scaptodrosophila lebanonensis]|uniref:Protein NASP homolog n=1 Tax=Drosophila lebanonensis TaxID=7225 RepID=A0A6J2TEI8_DROLE|nr:protein NASP homolog [Scaptodrosophila lebanonensis]
MSAEAKSIVAAADASPVKEVVKEVATQVKEVAAAAAEAVAADTTPNADGKAAPAADAEAAVVPEQSRGEKIIQAKELFSQGSRNFLVKNYDDAADELSQVCQIYEELYGELCDELGQPLLLYAKSLIAVALDENKVIDVPDEDDIDDDDDDEEEAAAAEEPQQKPAAKKEANGAASTTNGSKLSSIKESAADEADSTGDAEKPKPESKPTGSDEVSSSDANADAAAASSNGSNDDERPSTSNGEATASTSNGAAPASVAVDDEQMEDENEEGVSSNLQLAWELLEAAAKIFARQGLSGLPYLADVQTELANIEFENGIFDAARGDYEKALKIHGELPSKNRRVLAELHYKIGLTYLMQQLNKEGAAALRNSSALIEEEIAHIQGKETTPSEREKNNILDLEETRQEIMAKIQEIEEMQAQTIAEVRAALDSYIKPMSSSSSSGGANAGDAAASSSTSSNGAASSSSSTLSSTAKGMAASSSAISSSSKPTDITHLIKRKKPEEPNSEAEALCSPAKRAAV